MSNYNIIFFEKKDGSSPVVEFIESLTPKMRAKVYRIIDLLAVNGKDLRMPFSRSLGDGIFEIRTKLASDITRVLYFFVSGNNIILTNGFVKKTQKTPEYEIALAKKYREEYLSGKERTK